MTLKERWIEALLSGKYKPFKKRLRSKDGLQYDPFGVLCDVFDPFQWRVEWIRSDTGNLITEFYYRNSSLVPPDEILNLVGMSPIRLKNLMDLVDSSNITFSDVVDYLKDN